MSQSVSGAESYLCAAGITYGFHGNPVLKEVSVELERGEILALLGPNGSGKSTLLKIIAGILSLGRNGNSGEIRLRGQSILRLEPMLRARQIAYLGREAHPEFPITAGEAVALGRICHASTMLRTLSSEEESIIESAMKECHCWGLRDRELITLSGGERQLVSMARAFAQGARILLLDETLSQMDLHHQAAMGALLKKKANDGYAIVIVAHDLNLASEWADQCVLLSRGERVARGPIRQVLVPANLKELYPNTELVVGSHPETGTPKIFFGKTT